MNINKTLEVIPQIITRAYERSKYEPVNGVFGCIINDYFENEYNGDISTISDNIPTCNQCSCSHGCHSAYGEETWNKFFGIVSYNLVNPIVTSHYFSAELSLGRKLDLEILSSQYKEVFDLLEKYYLLTFKLNKESFDGVGSLENFMSSNCKDVMASYIAGEVSQYFYIKLKKNLNDKNILLDDEDFEEEDETEEAKINKVKNFVNIEELIGLNNVKEQLKRLKHRLEYSKNMSSFFKFQDTMLHTAFTGNPGVGKSMIAQWYADTLYSLGYIKTNNVVFAKKSDLIAGYIGHTPKLTQDTIDKSLGGVLFIDEAYTLIPRGEKDFAYECIDTLIANMTEKKDELVVIFAGYPEDIEVLLNTNPGLLSRVPNIIKFDDYSNEELLEIMKLKLKSYKVDETSDVELRMSDRLQDKIKLIFNSKRSKNFGNVRFAENLLDYIINEHACYCMENNIEDLDVLTLLDENALANY